MSSNNIITFPGLKYTMGLLEESYVGSGNLHGLTIKIYILQKAGFSLNTQ